MKTKRKLANVSMDEIPNGLAKSQQAARDEIMFATLLHCIEIMKMQIQYRMVSNMRGGSSENQPHRK